MAGVGLGAQAYAATPQTTGVLNITGKVADTSCVLDSTATSASVRLAPITKELLAGPGSSTGRAGFTLKVNDCPGGAKVSVAFVPDGNVDAHGNLKNTAGNPAGNVQVQVLDKDHRVININTDDNASQLARAVDAVDATPTTLQYYVQYYSAAGQAGNGDVTATANFQLTYE